MNRRIVYFSYDCADEAVKRRIAQLRQAGAYVVVCTFHRGRRHVLGDLSIDLGYVKFGSFFQRIPKILYGMFNTIKARQRLGVCDVVIARNLDMLIIGYIFAKTSRSNMKVIYEVLDIHEKLVSRSLAGKVLRTVERWLLKRTDLLVVSSPDYITYYFDKFHNVATPWYLLENKLYLEEYRSDVVKSRFSTISKRRSKSTFDCQSISIGWVGAFRCRRSAEIISRAARAFRKKIRVNLYGYPTFEDEHKFLQYFEGIDNVKYWGRYKYPEDLIDIYTYIDLNWCIDLMWYKRGARNSNSAWLLPNRLYEGGYFGVPQIGLAETCIGDRISEAGIGWNLSGEVEESLFNLIESLSYESYMTVKNRCLELMDSAFVYRNDIEELIRRV